MGPVALALLIVAFFWRLVLSNQYSWLQTMDQAYQVLPWFQFAAGEFHAGRFPLWDPYHFGGQPLLAQAQPGAAYPLNWLLFALPLHNGWLRVQYLHWYFVCIHVQAALLMYWFCRDQSRSRAGAVLSGLVFALGGYFGSNDWPQMLNGAVWGPLVLLLQLRALRNRDHWWYAYLAGAALGVAWLSGHHQVPIYLSLCCAGTWLFAWFSGRLPGRLYLLTLVAFLATALVGGLQTIPALEYGKLARRWAGAEKPLEWRDRVPYYVHEKFSLAPRSVLGAALPGLEENASVYVGGVALLLAAGGVWGYWREWAVRLLVALAGLGTLFALGTHIFVEGVFYSLVPLVEKARSPAMASSSIALGLAPLVAYGFDACRGQVLLISQSRQLARIASIAGSLILASAALLIMAKQPVADDRWILSGVLWLGAAAFLVAVAHGTVRGTAAGSIFALLILSELSVGSAYHFPHRRETGRIVTSRFQENGDIVRFLQAQHNLPRILGPEAPFGQSNGGDFFGLFQADGYLAGVTGNFNSLELGSHRVQELLGVRYWIAKEPFRNLQEIVFTGQSGVSVYADRAAYPRVFAVDWVRQLSSETEVYRQVSESTDNLRHVAYVSRPGVTSEGCLSSPISIDIYQPNLIRFVSAHACRKLHVIADTFYPGWRATIDGQPTEIHQVYGALRGVVVPSGTHTIEMRYQPNSVLLGGAMTLTGLLGAMVAIRMAWRRRQDGH